VGEKEASEVCAGCDSNSDTKLGTIATAWRPTPAICPPRASHIISSLDCMVEMKADVADGAS
jgi:hypothetical protein